MIDKIFSITKKICDYGIMLQGAFLLFMTFYICIDVFSRKLFSYSIKGSIELSEYSLAAMSGWIFSYALLTKAHVRIDILYMKLPIKVKIFLDLLSSISLLIFFIPLVYYSFSFFYTSFVRKSVANTPMHTPLWIPQGFWIIGLVFFVWTVFLYLIREAHLVIKGEFIRAYLFGGISSVEEEIEKEKGQ